MRQFPALTLDDIALRETLKDAHIPALMTSLACITGDMSYVRGPVRPVTEPLSDSDDGLSEEERESIRETALAVLGRYRDGGCVLPPLLCDDAIQELITFITGLPVPEGYMPLLQEELAIDDRDARAIQIKGVIPDKAIANFRVLIIGSGMSGILAAIRLQQQGISFLMVDKNERVGGTWWENTYPGCRVDSPNHLYSYMFDRNDDWPSYFSTRKSLFDYFENCVERHALMENVLLGTRVDKATFDEAARQWSVEMIGPDGPQTMRFNAIITAVGQLNIPKFPEVPGLDVFKGIKFHSARWEHQHDLRGKRVAVIGTGASATQFVPEIAGQPAHMTVFQRSAPWLLPTPNYHDDVAPGQLLLFRCVPYYAKWFRLWLFRRDAADGALPFLFADKTWRDRSLAVGAANEELRKELIEYLREQVGDLPDLLEKSIPDYPPGGKRPLRDCGVWLSTLRREDVDLIDSPISKITETGLITEDGRSVEVDIIIFGTGFHADKLLWPMEITGVGGLKLSEEWADGPRALKGATVPGFPNLFSLYGPNTNIVVGSSIIFFSECTMRYVMGCLRMLLQHGHAAMQCKREVYDAYNRKIDAENLETAWGAPGVRSWYKNKAGRVTQNWPGTHLGYWEITKSPDPGEFEFL